ncbi:MAG TPA: hypothetical protein VK154_09980 [Chitinophagales bacterium]|nr:hypothetical protein [Chitinophagales bacterium]
MKIKSLIVSIACMPLATGALMAQTDKNYLSGIVKVSATQPYNTYIHISLEGQPYKEELLKSKSAGGDYSMILENIAKLKADGWEIESTQVSENWLYYFLRKKKNQ